MNEKPNNVTAAPLFTCPVYIVEKPEYLEITRKISKKFIAKLPSSVAKYPRKFEKATKEWWMGGNISEEMGLEIENDKVNILIYFFFTPIGREKTTFKFYNNTSNSYAGWYNITHDDLKADKVRIIVANKLSGKIYYNKLFTDQTSQKHKKF